MTTFTVWKFDDPKGADQTFAQLRRAADDRLVKIVDHAIVSWPVGASRPERRREHDSVWQGTGWGAMCGVLIGALFLIPIAGAAVGAAIGAGSTLTEGTGIRKEELERVRTEVTEGTSALFLVTDEGDLDRLGERFHGMQTTLLSTNLTEAEREMLFETFGGRQR